MPEQHQYKKENRDNLLILVDHIYIISYIHGKAGSNKNLKFP